MLCVLAVLAGCSTHSYAGIPLASGAADSELQTLARRARTGDRQAQLELGIRYEEGRGVERDPENARRLYLTSIAGPRFQTQFVPINGAVVPENTAVGGGPVWPRDFAEIRSYHPSRIAALLRLCGLEQSDCNPGQAPLLRQLAQLETNFRACRIRTNLGNAGTNPYSFIFNAVDTGRRIDTRHCAFDEPFRNAVSSDQSRLVWTMWLALDRHDKCARAAGCDAREIRGQFTAALAAQQEDSPLWFAMRDALLRNPSPDDQVGSTWWWHICQLAGPGRRITANEAEAKICALIQALTENGTR